MGTIRPAAVAGTFYPADPHRLREVVAGLLAAQAPAGVDVIPRLLIVPHAGYVYSGRTAGKLYGLLREDPPRRIILLAPNHRVSLVQVALSGAAAFATRHELKIDD